MEHHFKGHLPRTSQRNLKGAAVFFLLKICGFIVADEKKNLLQFEVE